MIFKYLIAVGSILCFFTQNVYAFKPADFFVRKCSSCHTIGGGDLLGPDLEGIGDEREQEWLISFIKNSKDLINGGDPDAVKLYKEWGERNMPAFDLSDEEVILLLEFIEKGEVKSATAAQPIKPAAKASEADIEKGKNYFTGAIPFKNGGPSCLSCHGAGPGISSFGGGSLGPDLVLKTYPSLGDENFAKSITNIGFPTMVPVYKKKAILAQENYYIRSFLYHENKKFADNPKLLSKSGQPYTRFILVALLATGAFALGVDFAWKKRRRKTRRPY